MSCAVLGTCLIGTNSSSGTIEHARGEGTTAQQGRTKNSQQGSTRHRKDKLRFARRPSTVKFKIGVLFTSTPGQPLISPHQQSTNPRIPQSLPLACRCHPHSPFSGHYEIISCIFSAASFYFFLPPAGTVPRNAPSNPALNSSPIVSIRLLLLPGPPLFVCNSVVFFTSRFGFPDCSDFLPFSRKRRRFRPPWPPSYSPAKAVLPRFWAPLTNGPPDPTGCWRPIDLAKHFFALLKFR